MITIRPATLDDAAAIAHIHVEAWRTAYRNVLPDHVLDGLSEDKRQAHWQTALSTHRAGEFVLVAEKHGQMVGFIDGGPERNGDPQFTGEVYAIYLLDECRGEGIGTALFRRAVETLLGTGMESMKLWVLRDNPYRRFYDRLGGKLVGEDVVQIGGETFIEVAYGWSDLRQWFHSGGDGR